MIVNIDIELVYIFVLLFSCLFLVVIVVVSLYLKTLSKYKKLRTAGQSEKDESIIDNAQKVANKIIDANKNLDAKFDQAITTTIAQITSKWSRTADEVFDKNLKELNESLKNKVNEIYLKENVSLESYKKEKLKHFEDLVSEEVKKIAKDILKQDIDMTLHKKLIKDALENATKEGLFN